MRRAWWLPVLALVLAACSATPVDLPHRGHAGHDRKPNIVFVLTDDLSSNLVRYMPHVLALEKAGMTFTNYTVSDSFCCPSRSSILTGDFPHDTGVYTNNGIDGGFHIFHRRGEENHTFATALEAAGYRTGFMGKYLNGYLPKQQFNADGMAEPGTHNWVPPGWDTWDAAGWGYPEYHYRLNENHHVASYGTQPNDYLTHVINRLGNQFISSSVVDHRPFLLELSTFAPHYPYTPAPRDMNKFPGVRAPRGPSWDRIPEHAPAWLRTAHLTGKDIRIMDGAFRKRVQAVQSVDRMIGDLEQTLARTGQADNTVFVFSSDNGYHIGEHALLPGKLTAFDTDIEVPLVVAGPHIPAGRVDPSVVQNVDLAPTFEQLGGAPVPRDVDGHSFVPLLHGKQVPWRSTALVEHHGPDFDRHDPDAQTIRAGNPPTYEAIRTAQFTYIHYDDGQREYYDHRSDPDEVDNSYGSLSKARVSQLNAQVLAMTSCHGGAQCWRAGRPDGSD